MVFQENSDSIKDLGIRLSKEIIDWYNNFK